MKRVAFLAVLKYTNFNESLSFLNLSSKLLFKIGEGLLQNIHIARITALANGTRIDYNEREDFYGESL